jgi:hypothetical protein
MNTNQHSKLPNQSLIVVYLDSEYKKNEQFECPNTWTRTQIRDEVNKRYRKWYSFDIWEDSSKHNPVKRQPINH